MGKLTIEEINLICVFGKENREELIKDMERTLPYLKDSEMEELIKTVLKKLKMISSEEFLAIILEPAE